MPPTQAPSSPRGWPTSRPLVAGAPALLSNLAASLPPPAPRRIGGETLVPVSQVGAPPERSEWWHGACKHSRVLGITMGQDLWRQVTLLGDVLFKSLDSGF